MFFEKYPNTDFHELNLDWLLHKMRELEIDMDEFKVVNNITFSGQWDITKQYPAWTIVSDNNIGYVSIRPVPVGIPLTNGNYWVEVIDYTAQIAGLETRVIALENTVGDSNSGLVKDVNDLKQTVGDNTSGLVHDVSVLDNETTTEIVVFGDSWTDSSVPEAKWPQYVADHLQLTLHNYAVNGAGYVMPVTNLISSQVTVAEYDSTYNHNKVRYVVLGGGINDYRNNVTLNDLKAEITTLYYRLKTIYPNAKIIYVNNFQYPYTDDQSSYWYLLQYQLATNGVSVLNQDGYFKSAFFNQQNFYHLTQYGSYLYGSNIMSALSGGQIKNDGVILTMTNNQGKVWLKREDNLIHYYILTQNLSYNNHVASVTFNEDLCWVNNLQTRLIAAATQNYGLGICQTTPTSFTIACNNDITNIYFGGFVPLTATL